jgi:hypothetical protein
MQFGRFNIFIAVYTWVLHYDYMGMPSILHCSHLVDSKGDGHMSAWIRFGNPTGISQVYCQVCDLVLMVGCRHLMIVGEHRQQASAASLRDCFAPRFVSDL